MAKESSALPLALYDATMTYPGFRYLGVVVDISANMLDAALLRDHSEIMLATKTRAQPHLTDRQPTCLASNQCPC